MSSEIHGLAQDQCDVLNQILNTVRSIQQTQTQLSAAIESVQGQVNVLAGIKQVCELAKEQSSEVDDKTPVTTSGTSNHHHANGSRLLADPILIPDTLHSERLQGGLREEESPTSKRRLGVAPTSRIILTTYPNQSGIDPLQLNWGHRDPLQRGPVVVSRDQSTIRRRNAIGAHGGSYSIYHALAVASKNLDVEYRADFTNSEPAANIGPYPSVAVPATCSLL
ncbi:hypothetical protein ACLMJK_009612 [Lecanora helva]